jgi:hypothetical protein
VLERTELFRAGQDGYKAYRIRAIAITRSGTIAKAIYKWRTLSTTTKQHFSYCFSTSVKELFLGSRTSSLEKIRAPPLFGRSNTRRIRQKFMQGEEEMNRRRRSE